MTFTPDERDAIDVQADAAAVTVVAARVEPTVRPVVAMAVTPVPAVAIPVIMVMFPVMPPLAAIAALVPAIPVTAVDLAFAAVAVVFRTLSMVALVLVRAVTFVGPSAVPVAGSGGGGSAEPDGDRDRQCCCRCLHGVCLPFQAATDVSPSSGAEYREGVLNGN